MTAKKWEDKRRARFLDRCVYDTGPWDATHCQAGVDYDTVVDRSQTPNRRICTNPEANTSCEKRKLPTEEQYETWRQETLESMLRLAKIREAIIATGQQQGRIDCPCCNGKVGFSIASNGHVAAACSTEGCAKWME
jgi:hypothetical protein